MPEENIICSKMDIDSTLDRLENYSLNNHLSRSQDLQNISIALENGQEISLRETERLLAVCTHDIREDVKYCAFHIKNIIPAILSRLKMGKYERYPDLVPSACAVIHIIKTAALLNKADSLRNLSYDTLLSYPDDSLITVASRHLEEVMEVFNLYCHMRIPADMRLRACSLLHKLLKILPPEKKIVFVANGLSIWFSKIIPTLMQHFAVFDDNLDTAVETLDLLADGLVMCDYSECQEWRYILESVICAKKYPAVMKSLLQRGSGIWHRVWIVFIRLLKHQVTQSVGSIGTPINSMLPVVEAAFKVDVDNRCKAFECWNVLIDSFSTETNESNIHKRIKLLIIPLKSNNAKAEATALAKFRCWWHLIYKFQHKLDKFVDTILVPFLHFCFGKYNSADKSLSIPGQISIALKKLCIQAIVDMVGHVECDGCTDLPKLKNKLINTKNLVDNWNHWIFSLTSTIMMSANTDYGLTQQQMTCLWKSFIMTIGELPENNIRRDLFTEMLSILIHLVKECKTNSYLSDLVFNALVMTLFDGDVRIHQLLMTKNDTNDPLCKIVMVIVDPSLTLAYRSYNFREIVTKLTPVTEMILNPVYSASSYVIGNILKSLPPSDIGLVFWTALVESICASRYDICPLILCSVMMWPLKTMITSADLEKAAMSWYATYDLLYSKLKTTEALSKAIYKYLMTPKECIHNTYFQLCITLGVLKHKLAEKIDSECESLVELLNMLIGRIDSYQHFEQLFPLLIDRVSAIVAILISNFNEKFAQSTLLCVNSMLKVMTSACNELSDVSKLLPLIASLLKSLDSLFQTGSYHILIPVVIDDLIDCCSVVSQQSSIKNSVLSVMKTFSSKIAEQDVSYKKIKSIIDNIENNALCIEDSKKSDKNEFTTPKTKEVPKRTKKKEASIVNTVVENGEEYVVVKSNWKFNPRKLTENQKEKLQRKREDIPALYQDLSQSQDEFKLVTWKTDSQDTSNSSKSESKTGSSSKNETASEILSNLPSSDVVPKILENFFSENIKKDSPSTTKEAPVNDGIKKVEVVTPKNTKSPRLALKDRVFRNVRNLMEKSGVQKENKDSSVDLNKTETIIKTPVQSKGDDVVNIVNSAPPLLSADRPSRVKRKPKKFDELLLLSGKKSRQSLQDLKSIDKANLPNLSITPSKSNSEKNINPTSPTDSVSDEKEVNKSDLEMPEKRNDSAANEIPTKELHKDVQELIKESDRIVEAQAIEVDHKDNNVTSLDLDITSDKKVESPNNNKNENSKKKKSNKGDELKDENSFTKEDVKPDIKDDEINDSKDENLQDKEAKDKKNEESNVQNNENPSEAQTSPNKKSMKEVSTPQQASKNKGTDEQKSSVKKKKSRIEKELAIDMVEGHPFLKMQSEKRLTRKALESAATGRRKSLAEKLNTPKSETHSAVKSEKRTREKSKDSDSSSSSFTVDDSQERDREVKETTSFTEDLPYSDDVIESSQDSTITTISVKSTKKTPKKVPIVSLEKMKVIGNKVEEINESQSILDCATVSALGSTKPNQESRDDIELPLNKTAVEEKSQADLTENMDTEPIDEKELSDVIVINDDVPAPLTISSDDTVVGPETQELAEADTQPTDPNDFEMIDLTHDGPKKSVPAAETTNCDVLSVDKEESPTIEKSVNEKLLHLSDNTTITLSESTCADLEKESGASSPSSFKEEAKRKQDFLNNTLEISPIKNMSPERNKKSPSPETSSDYVVIKLSSPVHSNGEPFEKCGSPEVFTEEKISPDKRDQSPPRVEVPVTSTSPSSSLSLKKNRPQVRSGGRAAQMLGLCVPDKLQIINPEKTESEELKKTGTSSTPARRNLRILYNSVSENVEPAAENEDSENFLKFRRSLPAVDSSPSGPILKRKLVEIADDATISPASKRKRVSFHDPPVSTTVSVQKYIEPGGVRSPQNSAQKRLERQMRQHTPLKSPKRLDHAFKLDTVLTKAVESFSETEVINTPDDTQPFSLDETPVVEIVRASELNDTDPICPELVDCVDPIDNIAGELSSFAMKSLLVKELVGKVETVGDLAKMTELEVNRLCIKAPKVKVAKKVLSDYASKRVQEEKPPCDVMVTIDEAVFDDPMLEPEEKGVDMEVQTDRNASVEMEAQTDAAVTTATYIQTDTTPTAHTVVQTDETGSKSTADVIKTCLEERPDFVEQIGVHLEESSIQQLTDKLPFSALTDVLMKKVTPSDAKSLLNRILEAQWNKDDENRSSKEMSFIREYVCDRFDPKDLILFCSEVLKYVYEKPARP